MSGGTAARRHTDRHGVLNTIEQISVHHEYFLIILNPNNYIDMYIEVDIDIVNE